MEFQKLCATAFRKQPVHLVRAILSASLLNLVALPITYAADLIPNGDFETGSLIGWSAGERKDGISDLVTAGQCFSDEDTTHLTLIGNHAAILRSGPSKKRSSVGILTSDPFTAGDAIVFLSLTGVLDGVRVHPAVDFEVRLLNNLGEDLTMHKFNTSVVRLHKGCPSEPRDGTFYAHYIDTRKFLDQEIKIQFRQNTATGRSRPFTLIDEVIKFDKGEGQIFTSKPAAVAALSETRSGVARLDASHSFDPDSGPVPLTFSWQIDGEAQIRKGQFPCLADLSDGEYNATLFANDGFHVNSDFLKFQITNNPEATTDGETTDTETANDSEANLIVLEHNGCSIETVETETSVDDGTLPTDGTASTDGSNSAPTLDLDNDDSTTGGNNFSTTFDISVGTEVSVVDSDISIADANADNMESATVLLNSNNNEDTLLVDEGSVPVGITVAASATTVSFSGSATTDDYETALQTVSFDSDSASEITRSISISVNDGTSDSNTAFSSIIVVP
ncbi:MAG: hypothetical protein ACI8P9_002913 [Parasphingorhabdus sp.]|jgi:hypothetical protein